MNIKPSEVMCLVPCAHKIQKTAAKERFGPVLQDGWTVKTNEKCLDCNEPVKGYLSHAALAEQLSSMSQSALHNLGLPYPGKAGKFHYVKGPWQHTPPLLEKLKFQSVTKDSLIKRFNVTFHECGYVSIKIIFSRKKSIDIANYLKQVNMPLYSWDEELKSGRFGSAPPREKEQTTALFRILVENNDIPGAHKIRKIVEKSPKWFTYWPYGNEKPIVGDPYNGI